MEFSIKYTKRDYWAVVKFKMTKAILVAKKKKKNKFEILLFRLISPFVLLGVVIIASFKKLKVNYKFILSQSGVTRIIDEKQELAMWSRFICYEKTENFIMLQFDKNVGDNDGQALFPRRCFSETEWLRLIEVFEENNVNSGEIDLNMDI